jgi:biopolymer transport protein ExbD
MAFRPSKIKRHRREHSEPVITLTSMIDIFICLLLFLLQSYLASDEVIVSDQSFQLPASQSQSDPVAALTIKVNNDVVVLDNEVIGSVPQFIKQEDLLIEPLYKQLIERAEQTKALASKNPAFKFRGDLIIQGDRDIPFLLLKKIMYTCSRAEFGNIALAVLHIPS